MKRAVTFIVLVSFLSSCVVRTQQVNGSPQDKRPSVVISKRAGDVIVIDAEKREQFGFFPGIERFKEARFTVTGSGGYDLEVVTQDGGYSGTNKDTVAAAVLCDYIANYEEYNGSPGTFEKKWNIVAYDELGFPITAYEVGSIKNRSLPWACGGGCFLLGALPTAFLTMAIGGGSPSGGGDMSWTAGFIVILLGAAGSITAGSVIGNRISNSRAVKTIRESRKLIVIENR
jgi:hypothetical protein